MAVVAKVSADVMEGVAPLTVTFRLSIESGIPSTFLWDFGDGTTSTDDEPTHVYTSTGYHTVIVKITDTESAVTTIRMGGYIRIGKLDFEADVTKGDPPLQVNFVNLSAAPTGYFFTGYAWDFGDGSIPASGSTGATHTYQDNGNYNVDLSAQMYRL
ncbi:MAG: PKD domain-containing protein [Candidatus Altiarchaeales archaeon]|nr:PKD domain-containing protein [Candidatus Altiarchaeales archaeon]